MSCYVAHFLPIPDVGCMQFFHAHPEVMSIHVVISGTGEFVFEDKRNTVGVGSVITIGPEVPHSVYALPMQHLTYVAIQYPGTGYAKGQWKVAAEAGTVTRPGDRGAFAAEFGDPMQVLARATATALFESDRWRAFLDHGSRR
jgi:hypothetical protein